MKSDAGSPDEGECSTPGCGASWNINPRPRNRIPISASMKDVGENQPQIRIRVPSIVTETYPPDICPDLSHVVDPETNVPCSAEVCVGQLTQFQVILRSSSAQFGCR